MRDRFHELQAWLWGTAVTVPVVLVKMFVDRLIFTPLVGVRIPALGIRLRDMDIDLRALGRTCGEIGPLSSCPCRFR